MNVTEQLARFASTHDFSDIDTRVRHEAVRALVNWAACALGGANHEAVELAIKAFRPFFGAARANALGRAERMDAPHAALINGISSHVLDFDDTHLATLVHPSGPVMSALLAVAQHQPLSGRAFIDAIIAGIEIECRVALAVCPEHYNAGWHVTATAGVFGAAAAAGRALGLDTQRMAWALGIAATQASGLREMFGTMCKSLHPGRAAQAGLNAALLAHAGFTSSTRAIEAPRGFAAVLSPARHLDRALAGLGERWQVMENSYKPYACGVVIHPVIDACLALRREHDINPADIAEVILQVHPLVLELTGKPSPATGLEAKFSVFHAAAIVLAQGMSHSSQFSDEAVADPLALRLRECVVAQVRADIREDEAHARVVLKDGRSFETHVDHALGSLQRPMSDGDLNTKFLELAEGVLPAGQAQAALETCWKADGLADAGTIGRQLSPA
jgi:2-methylcitrate dehydratase PrpD